MNLEAFALQLNEERMQSFRWGERSPKATRARCRGPECIRSARRSNGLCDAHAHQLVRGGQLKPLVEREKAGSMRAR